MAGKTKLTRRQFTDEFKAMVGKEYNDGAGVSSKVIGDKHGVGETQVRTRAQALKESGSPSARAAKATAPVRAKTKVRFETDGRGNRVFTAAFKEGVLARITAGERVKALAHEYGISDGVVYRWAHNRAATGSAERPRGTPSHKANLGAAAPTTQRVNAAGKRIHSPDFKLSLVKRVQAGERVADVARDAGVTYGLLLRWGKNYTRTGKVELPPGQKQRAVNGHAVAVRQTAITPVVVESRADGRLDHYIKSDRAHLLQVIGMQTVELIKLKER